MDKSSQALAGRGVPYTARQALAGRKNISEVIWCAKLTSIRLWSSSQPKYHHSKSRYLQPGRCGREDFSLTFLHVRPKEKRLHRRIHWPGYCPLAKKPSSGCNCDVLSTAPSLGLQISALLSSAALSLDPRAESPCRPSHLPACCYLASMPRSSRRPCGQPMCPYELP